LRRSNVAAQQRCSAARCAAARCSVFQRCCRARLTPYRCSSHLRLPVRRVRACCNVDTALQRNATTLGV
jgi:hypothetical protein